MFEFPLWNTGPVELPPILHWAGLRLSFQRGFLPRRHTARRGASSAEREFFGCGSESCNSTGFTPWNTGGNSIG